MRHEPDEDICGDVDVSDEAGPARDHVGRPEFRRLTRVRIALLLALAIGLAWLPRFDPPPEGLPMRRARGDVAVPIRRLAFSPDGRTLATTDERGRVRQLTEADGLALDRKLDGAGHARVVAFAPDGASLAIGRDEPDVLLYGTDLESRGRPLGLPVRMTSDLRFAPDGRTLAISSHDSREITLWDIEARRPRHILRGHSSPVMNLAFAPDGRTLASAAWPEPDVLIWDVAAGRELRRLSGKRIRLPTLAFSPDGRLLATVDASQASVQLWESQTGIRTRRIGSQPQPIHAVAFSTDGRLLATGAADGTARLWDLATGREFRRLDGRADVLRQVVFSPDGRTLAASGNDGDVRLWDLDGRPGD